MGISLLYLQYFIAFFLIISFAAVLGFSILFLFRTNEEPSDKIKPLFYSLLIGVVSIVTIFSSIITKFHTVNLLFIVLFLFLIIDRQKSLSFKLQPYLMALKNFYQKNFLYILFCSFPFYLFEAYYFFQKDAFQFVIPFVDYVDMYNISQIITLTGQENNKYLLSNFYYPEFHGISPYHYFELWFNGFLSKLLPFPGTLTLMLFVYPFFYFASFIGLLSLWEHFGKLNIYKIFISFLLLFVGGMYFDFYLKFELLQWYGGMVGNMMHIWGKKMAIMYPFAIGFFLFSVQKKYALAVVSLFSICIVSIGAMPGIFAGLFLFVLLNFWHKTYSFQHIKKLSIITFFFVSVFITIYFAFGNKNEESLGFSVILNDLLNALDPANLKIIFFRLIFPILRLAVIFSPYFIFILYVFLKNKNIFEKQIFFSFIVLLVCILFSGAVFGAVASVHIFSGGQFFSNVFPLMLAFIMLVFIAEYSNLAWQNKAWTRVVGFCFILIFVFSTVYNIKNNFKLHKHYNRVSKELYSNQYLQDLTTYLNNNTLNPLGVCFMGKDDIKNYPLNSYGITGLTFSGMSVKMAKKFHAVSNLSIFDLPFDNLEGFSLSLYKSFEFYNFVKHQKEHNNFKSYEHAQLDFIHSFNIDYALVYKNGVLPNVLNNNIDTIIYDPVSEQRFVTFKNK